MEDKLMKEVFEKMDRQEELRHRISLSIPEILIVDQWKTYGDFLKKSQKNLIQSLEKIKTQNLTQNILICSEKEARFHLFNYYSSVYCFRQAIYEGKSFSKESKQFDELVTCWKKESIVRIAIAIRHKYQHGSLMEHILHYSVRTSNHPEGEGFIVGYNFGPETWGKIYEKINEKISVEYLKKIVEEDIVSPILRINKEFINACDNIISETQLLFEEVFADEFSEKQFLKDEYDKIESWFTEKGMQGIGF